MSKPHQHLFECCRPAIPTRSSLCYNTSFAVYRAQQIPFRDVLGVKRTKRTVGKMFWHIACQLFFIHVLFCLSFHLFHLLLEVVRFLHGSICVTHTVCFRFPWSIECPGYMLHRSCHRVAPSLGFIAYSWRIRVIEEESS